MAWLSPTGNRKTAEGPAIVTDEETLLRDHPEQLDVISRIALQIVKYQDVAGLVLPVTLAITPCFMNKSWSVLTATLAAALQVQFLVSMKTSSTTREAAHAVMVKTALCVFFVFWIIYAQNAGHPWAQKLVLFPLLITAACYNRQLYDDGVKMHELIYEPSFRALNAWYSKSISSTNSVSYLSKLWENGLHWNLLQQLVWGGASVGLHFAGKHIAPPGNYLTELPQWLIVGKTIASPCSILLLSKLELEKQKIDLEWQRGAAQAPTLTKTVKALIVTTGCLEALADVTAACAFVYAIRQSAFKVAMVSGALLGWKATFTWQNMRHRRIQPVEETIQAQNDSAQNINVSREEKLRSQIAKVALACRIIFGLAIPIYTITQAILNREDPLVVLTAIIILGSSFAGFFGSKAIQNHWRPENTHLALQLCRYLVCEFPDFWAYLAGACTHASKVKGMPVQQLWFLLGWFFLAITIGLNIADIDDFLHDVKSWLQPRLGALIIMQIVVLAAEIATEW